MTAGSPAARPAIGAVCLVAAAVFFALASALAKLASQMSAIPAVELVFFRYLVGFAAVGLWALIGRRDVRPRRLGYVALRSVFNIAGVTLLYVGLQATTVTKATMLNMTYPLFVFLLAPLVNRERNRPAAFLWLLLTLAGLYLIILPRFTGVNRGDLASLLSAVTIGASVSFLREARKHDSSLAIMFTMSLTGSVATFLMSLPRFLLPAGPALLFTLLSAAAGAGAQVLSTVGYRHVRAPTGSLLESSRMVFGSLLGALLFAEAFTFRLLAGGLRIVGAQMGTAGLFTALGRSRRPVPPDSP